MGFGELLGQLSVSVHLGSVLKTSFGAPASCMKMLVEGLSLGCTASHSVPSNVSGKQQMSTQVFYFLPPIWNTHMEFLAPGSRPQSGTTLADVDI